MGHLRWLHLSDFHVGKDEYGQRRLFRAIYDHVNKRIAEGFEPTFVFITGDVANTGATCEYEEFADEFLLPLSKVLGSSSKRLYMVPGNHDVNRKKAPFVTRDVIASRAPTFLDPTIEALALRREILSRFEGYIGVDLTVDGPHWLSSPAGALVDARQVGDLKVGIVGLNTAWHSQDDHDVGKLAIGSGLLESALDQLKACDVKLILGHHPLTWLTPEDAQGVRAVLAQHGGIYLHGHYHRTETSLEDGSGRLFRVLQSGAAFQARDDERWQNRLLWCELDWEKRKINVEPYTWVGHAREWRIDGRAFPEHARVPGTASWEFTIPGGADGHADSVTVSKPDTQVGWAVYDSRQLLAQMRPINDDELLRYFDGSLPDWSLALSHRVPRRAVVSDVVSKVVPEGPNGETSVVLLVGAGGEGKTTATLQAAAALLERNAADLIFTRSSVAASLKAVFPTLRKTKRAVVVIDDAHNAAAELAAHLQSEKIRGITYLLCSRDSDWESSGASHIAWSSLCKFHEIKLRGLTRGDAGVVVEAWRSLGEKGLGKLASMSSEAAAEELVIQATREAHFQEGAFLGALLRTRFGSGMRDHVRSVLQRFEEQSKGKRAKLIDAFAYICAVHSESLDILTIEILAWTMDVSVKDLRRTILSRLGEEAVATVHGNLAVTRHREIAVTAMSILTEERGYELGSLFEEIALAADRAANKGHFVEKLSFWRFDVVEHFAGCKRFGIARRLASALFAQNPDNPYFATKLAQVLRVSGEAAQAHELMTRAVFRVKLARDATRPFFNEWAQTCAVAGYPAVAVWLGGVALADLAGTPLDEKNVEYAIKTISSGLKILNTEAPASLDPKDIATHVAAAWEFREVSLPEEVPLPRDLSFERLARITQRRGSTHS